MLAKTMAKCEKAKARIDGGETMWRACKQEGVGYAAFKKYSKLHKESPTKINLSGLKAFVDLKPAVNVKPLDDEYITIPLRLLKRLLNEAN